MPYSAVIYSSIPSPAHVMGNNASALAEERARTARALAEERARTARAEERARAEARARASAEAELDDVRASAEAQLAEERARTARAEERARAEARARASAEAQLAKEREQRFLAERTLAAAVELLRDRSGGTEWKAKAQALLWAYDSRTCKVPRVHRPLTCAEQARLVDRMLR